MATRADAIACDPPNPTQPFYHSELQLTAYVISLLFLCEKMLQEKFDFFPLNRALSLSAMDEDSTESKVDDLLRQVHMLVERQKEEVRLSVTV